MYNFVILYNLLILNNEYKLKKCVTIYKIIQISQ